MGLCLKLGQKNINLDVKFSRDIGRTGDDQRGSGFINQNIVHLVDDGKVEFPLAEILQPEFHVVPQVIKAKLVVGAIGDIGRVSRLAGSIINPVHDHPNLKPEKVVKLAHPVGITAGQVIVDRDQVHPTAGQGVKIHRQSGYQGFALAGFHFGNFPPMQNDAAEELDIKMAHLQSPDGGFAHHGKGLRQQLIKTGPLL